MRMRSPGSNTSMKAEVVLRVSELPMMVQNQHFVMSSQPNMYAMWHASLCMHVLCTLSIYANILLDRHAC